MSLAERVHEVQALAADSADQTFTERVRLRNANRRLEHHQTHGFKRPVDLFRVNRVAIVGDESVRLVARHDHPKLLCGPLRCRMRRHVPIHDASCADFEDHEHVEQAEVAVTTTKKSLASTARAWFRTNVLHACVPRPARGGRDGIYRRTVRGETRMPSFTRSSAAIRSSPQVRLASAMVAFNARSSAGIAGRPGLLDFHRQNTLKPFRCQRRSVSGFTIVSRRRQSTKRDNATSTMRVASSSRRGFTCRSRYSAIAS